MSPQTDAQLDAALDQVLGSVKQETASQVSNNLQTAVGTNADQEAANRNLAMVTNLPVDTVRADPQAAKQQVVAEQVNSTALTDRFPHTAQFLTNLDMSLLAHDDVDNLSSLELNTRKLDDDVAKYGSIQNIPAPEATPLNVAKGVGRSLYSGAIQARENLTGIVADLFGDEDVATTARRKSDQAAFEQDLVTPQFRNNLNRYAYTGLTSLAQSTPGMVAGGLIGGPWGAALGSFGFGGTMSGAQQYTDVRNRGGSVGEASAAGGAVGLIEGATELLPMGKIIDAFGATGAKNFLRKWLTSQAQDQLGEQIATFSQDAVDTAIANPNKTWAEYRAERPEAAFQTAVATLVGGGALAIPGVATSVVRSVTQTQQAQQQTIQSINDAAVNSKLRARDPLAFEQFMQNATREGPVENLYVSAASLAQSGVDPAALAQLAPSVAAQLETAQRTGGDIRIPTSEFATYVAGTDVGNSLLQHVKTDPAAFSQAEADEYVRTQGAQLQEEVDRVLTERADDDVFRTSRQTVQDDILRQLTETNRFTGDVNTPYAALMANIYATMAARTGTTPEAFYKANPLKIEAELPGGRTRKKGTLNAGQLAQNDIRLARAREQGYDTDTTYYHGTSQDFSNFQVSETGKLGKGVYLSTSSRRASTYAPKQGGNVINTFVRGKLADSAAVNAASEQARVELDAEDIAVGSPENNALWKERTNAILQEQGFAGRTMADEVLVFDPKDIRSVNARFENTGSNILNQAEYTFNRGAFTPSTNTLTLLKNADLSTFLHETGHFMLEMMHNLAKAPNAPQELQQDFDATLKWFGIEGDTPEARRSAWGAMDLDAQRDSHEKFARGFEAYLFEGKAPSVELKGIFQRFRSWLVNIYRQLSALNVELSDDVRGVFNRMLATTDQIREAEALRNYAPLFKNADEAGMTQEEYRSYHELGVQATQDAVTNLESRTLRDMQWLSNAKGRELRKLQRDVAGKRRLVREEVAEEVMARPLNRAIQFIKRGTLDLSTMDTSKSQRRIAEMASLQGTKLSLPALKEIYGEGLDAPWRKMATGQYGYVANDGLHPDMVAELFGFSSGDQLVQAVLTADNPRSEIDSLTDWRMFERYGDITDPQAMERAAEEAIHNEARTKFIAAEMNALNKATGQRKVLAEAARGYADQMISRLKIRNVKPSQYTSAESRAARAADKARKAGDLPTAAVEKRNQLINNYATRAANEALSDVEKGLRYLGKFNRQGTRDNIDVDYLDQIDALLERFDLRRGTTLKAIDKRKSLLDWVASQEEQGIVPNIPPALLNEANRMAYKDMSVEAFRGLLDTVKQIEHVGRLKEKLLTAADERKFEAARAEIVQSILEHAPASDVDLRTRSNAGGTLKRIGKQFMAIHRKMANLAQQMDGGKDGGPMWQYFIRTMNAAGDKEAEMRADATRKLHELTNPILAKGQGKMGGKGQYFPTIGISLNREERIGIALNTGNAGNIQRLLDGEGWTVAKLQPVLDSLTKQEWDFVQGVWDFFEGYRPLVAAKERRVYGTEPDWVQPQQVVTPHGTYRGGYYPIKYDPARSGQAQQHDDAEAAKQMLKGAYTSATTRRSFTKARSDEVQGRPLLYSLSGLYQGTNEVIHDLSWHEWLIDVNRLLRNKSIDGVMRQKYGVEGVNVFKTAIRDIAQGDQGAKDAFERAINHVRVGSTIAGLGWNVVTSLAQPLGLTQSMVRIGPGWVGRGMVSWVQNPRAVTDAVYEKSSMMRLRGATMQREINEIQNRISGSKTQAREVVDATFFFMIQKMQLVADIPTWQGQYEKSIFEGKDERTAVALADQAVLDAQGGGQTKDLSQIQRGGPIQKLFTNFYSYFNTAYNLNVDVTRRTNWKDPGSIALAAGDYLLINTVPAVMMVLLREGVNALVGGDDDDDKGFVEKVINEQLGQLMGMFVGVREASAAVQALFGVNQYNFGYSGPAGLRVFSELQNLAVQVNQGELDRALRKSLINTTGIIFHYPSGQVNRSWDGIEAMIDGQAGPQAAVFGPPK